MDSGGNKEVPGLEDGARREVPGPDDEPKRELPGPDDGLRRDVPGVEGVNGIPFNFPFIFLFSFLPCVCLSCRSSVSTSFKRSDAARNDDSSSTVTAGCVDVY